MSSLVGIGGLYYISHLDTVPISGRRRFLDLSIKDELALSKISYSQIMTQFSSAVLPQYHPFTLRIKRVAEPLVKVSGLQDLNWTFHVIQSPQRNAFILPGGHTFVFTGLLALTSTDAELATILGHEIAHQVARHSAEKLSLQKYFIFLVLSLKTILGFSFAAPVLNLALLQPFSRSCESEADYIGLQLISKACYDPAESITLWKKMAAADSGPSSSSNSIPEFLSTHPSHKRRIQDLTKWMPEAKEHFYEAGCGQHMSLMDSFLGTSSPATRRPLHTASSPSNNIWQDVKKEDIWK